jgi:hypothetical protein
MSQVYTCEYQNMLVLAGKDCPSSYPATFPYFITNTTGPDACSCSLTYLYAAFLSAPLGGLKCEQSAASLGSVETCNCCSTSLIVSTYARRLCTCKDHRRLTRE